MFVDLIKFIASHVPENIKSSLGFQVVFVLWVIFYIVQVFLSYGTAYRCTKKGNNNGLGLFIYLVGFHFASLIPGLALHYYIKHLPPKVVIQQVPPQQPQVIQVPVQQIPVQPVITSQGQYVYQQNTCNQQYASDPNGSYVQTSQRTQSQNTSGQAVSPQSYVQTGKNTSHNIRK